MLVVGDCKGIRCTENFCHLPKSSVPEHIKLQNMRKTGWTGFTGKMATKTEVWNISYCYHNFFSNSVNVYFKNSQ